ncbi:MAG: hypothetical protein K2K05_03105, partial [Muribaculaceae bacterium]|nr:hypothetical protein [Muribaculaceae bacterium]
YMIAHKDCVIIPGVGAILASFESARIDRSSSILFPPKRVYTFNKDINHNDGMLACSIARAESIRYELACKKMESEIESMQHTLHSTGEIAIGNIGALRYSKQDDTIQFDPIDLTAGKSTVVTNMWLPTLKLGNKITFVTPEKAKAKIVKSPITKKHESLFRRITRLTASLALIAGICFLSTLLPSNKNDEAMKASLAPEFTANDTENLEEAWETITLTTSNKYKQYSEIDATATDQSSWAMDDNSGVDVPKFYVIVAAVKSDEEACRFISQQSDESLKSMAYKNLYVVYNSESTDKNEAFRLCCEAVKRYPGAWICTK